VKDFAPMTTEPLIGRSFTTDTMFIATVSAFAYLIVFLYEKGYCDHFGIPHTLIVPSVTNIFAAAVAMASALIFLLMLGTVLIPVLRTTSRYAWMKPYGEMPA
jgi:hypothetical protein